VKLVLASDHGGFEMKEDLKQFLLASAHEVMDVGTHSLDSVDYPDFGRQAAGVVARGDAQAAILVCSTGVGMCIVANKTKGVRAALVTDPYVAAQSRRHVDANCLVLGGQVLGKGLAREIVRVWLETPFEGGRHARRLEKIRELEND
jgi:RpiB/LacA/LacB family sugar-phosphate isomerase